MTLTATLPESYLHRHLDSFAYQIEPPADRYRERDSRPIDLGHGITLISRGGYGNTALLKVDSTEVVRIGRGATHGMAWFTRAGWMNPRGRELASELAHANAIEIDLLHELETDPTNLNRPELTKDTGIVLYTTYYNDADWHRVVPGDWEYDSMTLLLKLAREPYIEEETS